MESGLSEPLLLTSLSHMSIDAVETLAIRYLGVKHPQILTIAAAEREDIATRKIKVLQSWLARYTGPNAKEELYNVLVYASKDGLVPDEAYLCLKEGPTTSQDLNGQAPGNVQKCHSHLFTVIYSLSVDSLNGGSTNALKKLR